MEKTQQILREKLRTRIQLLALGVTAIYLHHDRNMPVQIFGLRNRCAKLANRHERPYVNIAISDGSYCLNLKSSPIRGNYREFPSYLRRCYHFDHRTCLALLMVNDIGGSMLPESSREECDAARMHI